MEQHLERQSGVQKVRVSLVDGNVEITPRPDLQPDPMQLLKATYDSGVSVAEMSIVARGQIVKSASSAISFQVSPSVALELVPNDFSSQLETLAGSGTWVTIRGVLYKKQKKLPATLTLTIVEVEQKE